MQLPTVEPAVEPEKKERDEQETRICHLVKGSPPAFRCGTGGKRSGPLPMHTRGECETAGHMVCVVCIEDWERSTGRRW